MTILSVFLDVTVIQVLFSFSVIFSSPRHKGLMSKQNWPAHWPQLCVTPLMSLPDLSFACFPIPPHTCSVPAGGCLGAQLHNTTPPGNVLLPSDSLCFAPDGAR